MQAQHDSLTTHELAGFLELDEIFGLSSWMGRLQKFDVIKQQGKTQATRYFKGLIGNINNELAEKINALPDTAKLELVDSILSQLDRPDPEIDKIWAEDARKRWKDYKSGKLETVSYKEVMGSHRPK